MKTNVSKTMRCLLAVLLMGSFAFGVMRVKEGGTWPANWPQELEPLREQATTGDFRAGAHATYYYIEFSSREQFEQAWPALCRIKSKGAPLSLMTVDQFKTDPNDRRVLHSKPTAVVVCPASGEYVKNPDGSFTHRAKWTDDIESQLVDGVLPQFVGKDSEGKWHVITDSRDHDTMIKYGFYEQARVDILLYVDGEIIDLNRIRLPEHTPIKDHRKTSEEK